ncbi:deoxynucleoside triphosphate triphosphohydrolase SAMHD1-like [Boleophthalmus pectinirostris]|uniref:deoxynucleoside triphosphate triphosphohydrolase SAMHD1-like n=1 Tax=Boleophthalmus pectinirostris TaxID=150288 RepID=UPI002432111A|nr:deoxynucleoside triphosphate triphosphohydrolase SAMHD1-like [Boleophthalmus pectinirostris]
MSTLYDLAHTVEALHTKAYTHNVTINIELMMEDVIKEHIEKQRIQATAKPAEIYSKVTDSLLVERTDLEKAKSIVKRIHSRDLYKYVTKVNKDEAEINQEKKGRLAEALRTKENNIVIHVHSLNSGNQDPISGMIFFDKGRRILDSDQIEEKVHKTEVGICWPLLF